MKTIYKYLIGIALLAGMVAGAIFWYNGKIEQATENGRSLEREAIKTGDVNALLTQRKNDGDERKENASKDRKVVDDHEAAKAKLKKKGSALDAALVSAGGMRIPRAVCDPDPVGSKAPGNGDYDAYIARTVELPEDLKRLLYSEADRADEIVEGYREAQHWAIAHGFYPAPSAPDLLLPNDADGVALRVDAPAVEEPALNQPLQ